MIEPLVVESSELTIKKQLNPRKAIDCKLEPVKELIKEEPCLERSSLQVIDEELDEYDELNAEVVNGLSNLDSIVPKLLRLSRISVDVSQLEDTQRKISISAFCNIIDEIEAKQLSDTNISSLHNRKTTIAKANLMRSSLA